MIAARAILESKLPCSIKLITDGFLPTLSDADIPSLTYIDLGCERVGLLEGDIIISGMMWPGGAERLLMSEAKRAGAISIVVLSDIAGGAEKFLVGKEYHLPNYICVSDTITYGNLVSAGISESIIISIGSMYLDHLFNNYSSSGKSEVTPTVGYLSVPNKKDFSVWGRDHGFDEVEIAQDLSRASEDMDARLIIRKHPKEYSLKKFDITSLAHCEIQNHKAGSITTFLEKCSVVVSSYSTALIIANRMGCPAISYQPNCTSPVREALYRALDIPIISSYSKLQNSLRLSEVDFKEEASNNIFFNLNQSTESFVNFISGFFSYVPD